MWPATSRTGSTARMEGSYRIRWQTYVIQILWTGEWVIVRLPGPTPRPMYAISEFVLQYLGLESQAEAINLCRRILAILRKLFCIDIVSKQVRGNEEIIVSDILRQRPLKAAVRPSDYEWGGGVEEEEGVGAVPKETVEDWFVEVDTWSRVVPGEFGNVWCGVLFAPSGDASNPWRRASSR